MGWIVVITFQKDESARDLIPGHSFDPWWYQQLPYVQLTFIPVRERHPNTMISLDQALSGGGIGRPSML